MTDHASPLDVLLSRASTADLVEPSPKGAQLRTILSAGLRAPDHGKLRPWRYTVIKGKHRAAFAELVAQATERQEPDAPRVKREKRRERFATVPAIIALGMQIRYDHKIPVIEQEMSVAAGAMNVLNALHAEGFGGVWITGAFCEDGALLSSLGLRDRTHSVGRLAGFLFVGTPEKPGARTRRPRVEDFYAPWKGSDATFTVDEE